MKKKICYFLFLLFVSSTASIKATKLSLASGVNDGLETKIANSTNGDTIVLTDIGPYNSTSPKIAMTKSITIMAAAGLSSRPLIKVTAITNQTNYFSFSTGGPFTFNLIDVEFDGNSYTQVLVQSSVKTKITMRNCIVRNFVYPSPGIAGAVFGYSNLVGGHDQLYVEDSKFYNTGGVLKATSTAYPTTAIFKNCYFDAITAFTDKNIIYNQAPAGNTIIINHCTFNACNFPELQFASCSATVQNCLFLNSTASTAPILGTADFMNHCAIYCTTPNIDVIYPLSKRDGTTLLANPTKNSFDYATSITYINAASDGKAIGFSPKLKVVVSPLTASILKDDTQQYSAVLSDSISAFIPLVSTLNWTSTAGSINISGSYTGSVAGSSITVTANSYGCKGFASVKVTGVNMSISPSSTIAYLGYPLQFSSSAVDQDGQAYLGAKTWSATGGVGTINTSTGLFIPSALGAATITANIGSFSKTISINVVVPATTVNVSMGTHNFSWTFDKANVEQGYFADGQPWIVLPAGGVNLIAASPARIVGATVKDATGANITADINQTVINPPVGTFFLNNTGAVLTRNSFGWDSRGVLRSMPLGSTYDATLAWNGTTAVALNVGDIITTAESLVAQTPANTVLDAVAVLSVLAATPPADAFRPGFLRSASRKVSPEFIRVSDIVDLSPYLISQPVNSILNNPISIVDPIFTASTLTNLMPGPSILNAGLLQNRGTNALYNNSGFSYGADVAQNLGDVALGALATWLTPAERLTCRIHLIQRAIDTYESLLAGVSLSYNGGHLLGYGALITIAGKILNHAGMMNINQTINEREPFYFLGDYSQSIYIDDSNTNYNDGITPNAGNSRRVTTSSTINTLNKSIIPITTAAIGSLTVNNSYIWSAYRAAREIQNLKLKIESGAGAGSQLYIVTGIVDFIDASTGLISNDFATANIKGGTLTVKPNWVNGIPDNTSIIGASVVTASETPCWAFKSGGLNSTDGSYTGDFSLSPVTDYGTINVGAYLSYFIAMYALDAENVYSSGLDRWLIKTMSIPGYGEAIFTDGNSRRPNGITNYLGSLYLSGLWKEQVLDKKIINYVHGAPYATSYAACAELLAPSANVSTPIPLIQQADFKLYYNVGLSQIEIKSESSIEGIRVYSLQGVELMCKKLNGKQIILNMANYPKSCYLLQVISGGSSTIKKVLVD